MPKRRKSLADRARARGFEPETEEGGRAMMQSITMDDVRRAEASRKLATLKPGDQVKYTTFTVGGQWEGVATVVWDYGRTGVDAIVAGGKRVRLERAPSGKLRRYGG